MIYQFEDFELDTDLHELRRGGMVCDVEPQVFALLTILISNAHRMVTKDEIVERIWNGRIISEAAIHTRVRLARKAVGDDGKQQRLIKTVHSQGLRFVGRPVVAGRSSDAVPAETDPPQENAADSNGLTLPDGPSIAVLPFKNLSDAPIQDHFAGGMLEDIVTVLSKVPKLFVIAHSSTAGYQGQNADCRRVRREQGVRYVLDGSIRRHTDQLRITAQLIDTDTGQNIWAERYDRKLDDIFALQDEMTLNIVSALQIELTEGEQARLWLGGTQVFKAWESQVQAPSLINTHIKEKVLAGRALTERALAHDETYAAALTSLGLSHFVEAIGAWGDNPEASLKLALEAAQRSLAIDETNPVTLALIAFVQVSVRDYEAAYDLASKAFAMAPNNAEVASAFGLISLYCNRLDGIDAHLKKAMRLCPIYPAWYPSVLACAYLMMDRLEDAVATGIAALKIDPDFMFAYPVLAIANQELERTDDAAEAVRNMLRINPRYSAKIFTQTQPFSDEAQMGRFLKGLTEAGLPQ